MRERIRAHGGEEAVANIAPDQLTNPGSIAEAYWYLYSHSRDAWTFEMDVRPFAEAW